ncbi:SPRY domain-containing SOCS box protein 3 isoform X1 [Plutella xylostella]|nr:SPRY domain-containing SOCS box protein 3 isoform X1 [Plutella xylostella]
MCYNNKHNSEVWKNFKQPAKMLIGSLKSRRDDDESEAKPFCQCWEEKRLPVTWKQLSACSCGEDIDAVSEWKWRHPDFNLSSSVVVSEDQKQVTFHPSYSSGTAVICGDTALQHGHHYYWEVKMLTETYGTDIMIGIGSNKTNLSGAQFEFTSLLGGDSESYGLSYRGGVRHGAGVARHCAGFCRGSIVGVRVDMWRGTLEFYLNREPQGISFYNLRRHPLLFPMLCSTAAQSSMRLTYAASWRASLLVDAAKVLAAAANRDRRRPRLPPGLWHTLKSQFWLILPTEGCIEEDKPETMEVECPAPVKSVLTEILPSPYMNGFYVDSIEPNYRLVLWQ